MRHDIHLHQYVIGSYVGSFSQVVPYLDPALDKEK